MELDIEIELSEISGISKNKFRSIVKEQTNKKALQHLLDRKASRTSVHAKGKAIEYSDLSMAEYLSPSELDISIDDKKWLFKCRTEDIDLSSNRRWMKEDMKCSNCKNIEMDQRHLLECTFLLGKNKIVTYIPEYNDIYQGNIEEMVYTSRILRENLKRMKTPEDHVK